MAALTEGLGVTAILPALFASGPEETGGLGAQLSEILGELGVADTPAALVGVALVFGLIKVVLDAGAKLMQVRVVEGLILSLRRRVLTALSQVGYREFASRDSAHHTTLLTEQIPKFGKGLFKFAQMISAVATLLVYGALAAATNLTGLLAAGALAAVSLPFLARASLYRQGLSRKQVTATTEVMGKCLEMLRNFKYLFATAQINSKTREVVGGFRQLWKLTQRNQIGIILVGAGLQGLIVLGVFGLMAWLLVGRGQSPENVLLFVFFTYRCFQCYSTVQDRWQQVCANSGPLLFIDEAIRELESQREWPGELKVGNLQKLIELDGVSFGYCEEPVISDAHWQLAKNTTVGIVGKSGAGKSTLLDLLCGVYAPDRGRIVFDGKDYRDIVPGSLRQQIGRVLQEPVVFSDTIAGNITMQEPGKRDEKQLNRVVEMTLVEEFAAQFPEGLETQVGEGGDRLSGGQRQRISIARELYRDTPLLVFDEATSALDSETERLIQHSIDSLAGEKTLVIIAHRFSTLKKCDKIVYLADGRIQGVGTWEEMTGGRYPALQRMVELQGELRAGERELDVDWLPG